MSRVSIYAFAIAAALLLLSSAKAQHWTYGKGCAGLKLAWTGTAKINTVLFCNLTSSGLHFWPGHVWVPVALSEVACVRQRPRLLCVHLPACNAPDPDRSEWRVQSTNRIAE